MSNNLYEEAIKAAEQIKEAAENRVKQQLIEAMSPKIREMIEQNYLSENENPNDENPDSENSQDDNEDTSNEEKSEDTSNECGESVGEVVEISAESVKILKNMFKQKHQKNAIQEKLETIREGINHLKKAIIIAEGNNSTAKFKKKFVYAYQNLLQELKNIKSSSIIKTDKTILKEFLQLSKELNNMSRRKSRSRYLNESLEDLLEMNLFEEDEDMPEEMDVEEEEMDAPEDESEGGMQLKASVEDMSVLELLQAADLVEEMGDEEKEEGGEEEGDEEPLDLEDDLEEAQMESIEEVYEIDEGNMEGVEAEGLEAEGLEELEELDEGLFLEIDENMLKREINNMRRLREGDASDMAQHFGGGSLDREMFVDSDEDKHLNVHADHLGREDVPTPKVEAALRKVMRKNRMLESKASEYRNALQGMKKQLSEMNLFNAKLLYANKLMQNRDLSIKQQRHIVESLDEAGTLNEAKLLFESLSKSLSRPSKKSGNLSESASRRVLSSSSRSVRSAQPVNESVALDRWATLAGIKK